MSNTEAYNDCTNHCTIHGKPGDEARFNHTRTTMFRLAIEGVDNGLGLQLGLMNEQ